MSSCRSTRRSKRSFSADPGLDVFWLPDGSEFALPSAWGVKRYITQNPKRFRTSAFRSLEPGDLMHSEAGSVPFIVPAGFNARDLPLKMIERPERACIGSWLVDQDRLLSVLHAMITGVPLPPIQVESTESGCLKVVNGFHRYYASVILRYTEVPVLWSGLQKCPEQARRCVEDCRLPISGAMLLEETSDDGAVICVEALVVAPKKSNCTTLGANQRRQRPRGTCRPRYEPPAVRRERLLREEQQKKQRELTEKAVSFRMKALSKEAKDQERCQQMRRASVTYAEKAMGRLKAGEPPTWDEDPAL